MWWPRGAAFTPHPIEEREYESVDAKVNPQDGVLYIAAGTPYQTIDLFLTDRSRPSPTFTRVVVDAGSNGGQAVTLADVRA